MFPPRQIDLSHCWCLTVSSEYTCFVPMPIGLYLTDCAMQSGTSAMLKILKNITPRTIRDGCVPKTEKRTSQSNFTLDRNDNLLWTGNDPPSFSLDLSACVACKPIYRHSPADWQHADGSIRLVKHWTLDPAGQHSDVCDDRSIDWSIVLYGVFK